MNRVQAEELFRRLCVPYRVKAGDDLAALWLGELRKLSFELGEAVVESLIASCEFFPTPARFNDELSAARTQQARRRKDEERRAAEEAADRLPKVALREIPSVVELMERWSEPLALPEAGDGACDDGCGRVGIRYRLGRFAVCRVCGGKRLRAKDAAA